MSVTENATERMVRYRLIAFCHAVCCRRESLRPGTFLSQSSGSSSSTAGPGRWSCRPASGYGPPPSPPRRLGLGIRRGSWAGRQDGAAVGAFLLDKRQLHRRQPVQEEPHPQNINRLCSIVHPETTLHKLPPTTRTTTTATTTTSISTATTT